jgi:hypothetical protein
MPPTPMPALVDALISDLHSGALSITIGVRIVELLKEVGHQDAATEIEQRWLAATSADERISI